MRRRTAAARPVVARDVHALEHDRRRSASNSAAGAPGGGLAAAALAHQPERLAAPQREADAVDRLTVADLAWTAMPW